MTEYHEPWEALSEKTRDIHRAARSLMEEIEAIDWYHQRVDVCTDDTLRAALAHNRDEEIEHACMMLEWLRRNMPGWDENLRTYLFKDAPSTEIEVAAEGSADAMRRDLGIGSLKKGM